MRTNLPAITGLAFEWLTRQRIGICMWMINIVRCLYPGNSDTDADTDIAVDIDVVLDEFCTCSTRKRHRVEYFFPGFGTLCRTAYMLITGLKERRLRGLLRHVREKHSFAPRSQTNTRAYWIEGI